jgi:pimeloyl-ACP methyl ester carboxylesterase
MIQTLYCNLLGTQTRFYQTAKYRTRAIEVENDKLPLIFLHGGGGHAESFARNIVALSEVARPIAIDFIWHGLSSKPRYWAGAPKSGHHWLNQFTDHLLDFMDARGINQAVIEGQSLGGWVAIDFALHHPDRVAGLVLNTAWGITFDPTKVKESKEDLEALLRSSLDALNNPSFETIRRRLEWVMPLGGITDEIVAVRKLMWTSEGARDALTEYYKHLHDESTAEALFSEKEIALLRPETLVIWSDHNPLQGLDAAYRLGEILPKGTIVTLEKAAHWPQWEKPDEHNQAVRDFITSL